MWIFGYSFNIYWGYDLLMLLPLFRQDDVIDTGFIFQPVTNNNWTKYMKQCFSDIEHQAIKDNNPEKWEIKGGNLIVVTIYCQRAFPEPRACRWNPSPARWSIWVEKTRVERPEGQGWLEFIGLSIGESYRGRWQHYRLYRY